MAPVVPKRKTAIETASSIRFGHGVTKEVGMDFKNLGSQRVMVVTDSTVGKLDAMKQVIQGLEQEGVAYDVFDKVRVEPKDSSIREAIDYAKPYGPDAFLAVDMAEGFTVGDSAEGGLMSASSNKGMHGFDPENPNMRASFVVAGAGVAHCSQLQNVRLMDAAPTAAALLGVQFPHSLGQVQKDAISSKK